MFARFPGNWLLSPLIFVAMATAGNIVLAQGQESVVARLTPKVHGLLLQEMALLNEASQEVLIALVAGDDGRVAELAQQIHDSFILRQSMTAEDREHLKAVAPQEFLQMDQNLHEMSALLAEAALAKDKVKQNQHFGQMIQMCTACHARFTADRFPGFAE